MKKLFILSFMLCLLGGNRAWAAPHYYFSESSKVLSVGASSFNFMSNQLMASGISTNSGSQQRRVFSGWVVFNADAKMDFADNCNGGTAYGDPHDIIDIGAGQFSNISELQAGWTLRVNFDFAQDDWYGWFFQNHTTEVYWPIQNNLNKVDGWHQVTLNGNTFWSMYGYYEAVLTAEAVTYLKQNGINLRGKSITIQSVDVIPPATTYDANSFDWTAETYGEVVLTSGYSNKSGNKYTLSTSNQNLGLNGQGGSIVIIATGKQNTAAAGYRAYYVVTVPYPDNHVWDFFTDPGITPRTDANWTDDYKSKPQNGTNSHKIIVATPNESATDGYNYINKTNAFYIPETAGLLFDVKSARLGYNNEGGKKLVTWGGYHITSNGSNNDGSHPKFIIPQVKGEKYIRIWWDAMAQGTGGGNFKVTNLLDLEGRLVSNQFSITGVTVSGQCMGCIIFKVNGSASNRQDITIEMQDQGWNDLYKIEICDDYDTDMVLFQSQNNTTGWQTGGAVEYNNEYGSIVHKKGEKAVRYYGGTPGPSILNRGMTCDFTAEGFNGVTFTDKSNEINENAHYNYLYLTDIDGTGNIKITQREKFGADNYVLNKKETWIAVGEYTQQSYPYTWDFTDYNVKKGSLEDGLKRSPSSEYGYWELVDNTNGNKVYGLDTHVLVDATKGNNNFEWNNVQIEKPLFAQGSQLTYGVLNGSVETILETEGLRVKQCNDSESELGVGGSYDHELRFNINSNGGGLRFASNAHMNHKLYITIPNVTAGMWVFVKADRKPEEVKVGTNTLSVDTKSGNTPDTYNTQDDVWAYQVTNTGDVDICYQGEAGVDIKAIGVTDIFKSINLLGYASESRNHAIDHTYEGFFTKNEVNAYCIYVDVDGSPYNYKGIPIVMMSESYEVNYVPRNTGVVLFKSGHDKTKGGFDVPLFYPACNVKIQSGEVAAFKANWMAPWVDEEDHDSEEVYRLTALNKYGDHEIDYGPDNTTNNPLCTKFVMSRKYYVYNKTYNSNSGIQTDREQELEAFYRMRISTDVSGTSNTMAANRAYLLIPTAKLPLALWNPQSNGEGKPGLAKSGVIFMDDIMDLFSEDEPSGIATAIDAIESAETVDNGNTYYTLSGMKIQGRPTEKGVYIMNGKKVLVK